jgi:succinate-semialdehyde dehydrogenase/glutarate-semialdehyde dehydrogenase
MAVIPAIDPATGEVFAETPATPPATIEGRVRGARAAQAGWAARSLSDRQDIIHRFKHLLYRRRTDVAALITRENGKPLGESLLVDVAVTLDIARYYLKHAGRILEPRRVHHGNPALRGKRGWIHWDPMGVIAIISPWNYPLLLPFGELIPALLAGNAVILKPSEFTTRTALLGAELLHAAGLPQDLCQIVVGGGEVGAALVAAGPDKIFFTGSAATGRKVAVAAAERLIPVNLELGGSDPSIVLADADLEHAASGIIWARYTNGGQTCVAAKRVIVERPAYEPFVEILVRKVGTLRLGAGSAPGVDVGPIIRLAQLEALERQLAESVKAGARVRTGGRRRPDVGPTFFEPTVLTDVPLTSPVWREEVFGPILPVVPADTAEDAIRLANDSTYGLSASIWTGKRAHGELLARQVQAGSVLVNDATYHVGAVEAPHGGKKESGLGRTHGEFGLLETCQTRYIGSDLLDRIRKPWWFPYDEGSLSSRDAFMRFAYAPSLWERLLGLPGTLRLLFKRGAL